MASVLGAGLTTSIGFTPGYAAPENLRGEAGGPDVDVYALGASLFQLLTGRVPFADPTGLNNLVALAVAIEQQPVENLRPRGVPDRLCQVIESTMAKQPAHRPTVAALAEWLTMAAAESSLAAGPTPVAASPAAPPAPGALARNRGVRPAAHGPAPATIDGPADRGLPPAPAAWMPASGAPFPAPPAPAGAPFPAPPNPADLVPPAPAPWSSAGRIPNPDPLRPDIVADPSWAPRSSLRLFRRQHPDRRAGSRWARRWSTATVFGGAAATGLVVAFLTSLLPGVESSGGSGSFGATTTTSAAFFSPTTSFAEGGAVATTWGPSVDDATTSMAAYEVQWDKARADALSILSTPGALDAALPAITSCPDAWSDTAGIEGTTIALDLLIPDNTGSISEAGRLAQGLVTYFDWVNANGGIGADHRSITARLVDDSTRTAAGADPGGAPFAVAALDPGVHADSVGDLTARCIPEPLAVTPHPSAGDAVTYPWTTGGPELSLSSEARLWAELIGRQYGDPSQSPSIVVLAGQDETGALYRQAFDQAMADRAGTVTYIVSPDELTEQPQVLIVMAAPEECRTMIPALTERSSGSAIRIVPAACTYPSTSSSLASTSGWSSLPGGIRDATNYYYDDAFQRLIDAQLQAADLESADPLIRKGFGLYGWLWQQTLEIAAALPGGLTRTNLVAAQRHLTGLTHPMLMTGITLATGPDDPWLVEGSAVTRGSSGGSLVIDDVIDVNGSTPRCRWEGLTHRCGPA